MLFSFLICLLEAIILPIGRSRCIVGLVRITIVGRRLLVLAARSGGCRLGFSRRRACIAEGFIL